MKTTPLKAVLGLAALALCLGAPLALHAQPDEVVFNSPTFGPEDRGPVPFPHETHMATYDCLDCHHRYQGGENVADPSELVEGEPGIKCAACHLTPGKPFQEGLDAPKADLMQAMHGQCLPCHRTAASEGASGPRTCAGCHKDG